MEKHKWKDNECTTCECTREGKRGTYVYRRSDMTFSQHLPDCIDWKVEDKKTID